MRDNEECLIICREKVLLCKKASETFIHGKQTCSAKSFGNRSVGVMFVLKDVRYQLQIKLCEQEHVQIFESLIFVFLLNVKESYS